MKTSQILPISLILAFCISLPIADAEAQILNRLKRKLEDKIEKMGEEEVDKEISKKVDQELNQDTTQRTDTSFGGYDRTNQALLEGILGSKMNVENVELPERYTFEMSVTYDLKSDKNQGSYMKYLLPSENEQIIGFEILGEDKKPVNKIVWDLEREVMVMYSEDKKGNKSLQKLPSFTNLMAKQMEQENQEKYGETTIEKTGRTKIILGYKCTEYKLENKELISHSWIAEDFPYNYKKYAKVFAQQMQTSGLYKTQDLNGFPLAMTTEFKDDQVDTTEMEAIEINEKGIIIDNTAYQK